MAEKKYLGWNFIDNKWEEVTKEVYDSLLDPARCVAPQSPDLEREGKELLEKFKVTINMASGMLSHNAAKQCAVIHCELMIKKLTELLKSELHNDFGIMAERGRYTQLIEQINKL